MSSNEVELTARMMIAIASPTRRNILKKINIVPKTISELSRELNLNKSTVYKHINILLENRLVTRKENGNEFVYYELTTIAKKIIAGKVNVKIIIILLSVIELIMGSIIIYTYLEKKLKPPTYWDTGATDGYLLFIGAFFILILMIITLICLYKIKMSAIPPPN